MSRLLLLLSSVTSLSLFASVQLLPSLPNGAVSRVIQSDAAGNVFLAGTVSGSKPGAPNAINVFVAKVSADRSNLSYFTALTGSSSADVPAAIAIGRDGSAYVAGSTQSPDFPVTPGAFETTYVQPSGSQGFLVKMNPAGTVMYSSFINGTAFTQVTGMALGKAGEVYLAGTGGPDYPRSSGQPIQGFILKLDASLTKVLQSIYGYGGGLITLDGLGNMYLAGSAMPTGGVQSPVLSPLPAGAFQSTHAAAVCSGASGGPSPGFLKFCSYQYVAQLDPSGKLLWGTYVTGTYGAIPAGMFVDSVGNVIVAGTTNSSDYPVTPGAFQTAYTSAGTAAPNSTLNFGPPNSIGYVTKVASGGTALQWSTYFGGSSQDQITGMAVTPSGVVLVSGRAASSDLVLPDTPEGCRPSPNQVLGFVAILAADGATAGPTQLVHSVPDCLYINCMGGLATYQNGWPLALRSDGTAIVAGSNGSLAAIDFASTSRVACVTDPADNAQLNSVAPGQLISIFGANLAPPVSSGPPGGVAQSSDNLGVFFNGIPAPMLYSSTQQINVQVPFEIAGAATVQMQVVSKKIANPVSETRTLGVATRAPAIFLTAAALESPIAGWSTCGGAAHLGQTAVALNADGTLNDCTNPASAGTPVTVFLNGFGMVSPTLATGAIAPAPAVLLTPSMDPGPFTGTSVIATQTVPGAITGVAQAQLLPGGATLLNGASLGGVLLRDRVILVWTK